MQLRPSSLQHYKCKTLYKSHRPSHLVRRAETSSVVYRSWSCRRTPCCKIREGRASIICKTRQNAAENATAQAEAPSTSTQNPEEPTLERLLAAADSDLQSGELDVNLLGSQIQELLDVNSKQSADKLEQAKAEAQNKYLRLSADFDNFRKRSASERERQSDQIRGDVVKQLIPLVDSFEAAQASIKAETEEEKQRASAYQGLYKQMVEIFKSLGVEAVPGAGQPFDPEYHDAILREENNEVPNGTVLQELRRGFKLGKTLLRASMVKVSFSEEPTPEQPAAEE